jgi:hypothetical protein
MISKETARNQLLIGYIFAAIGFAIGASNDIYNNPLLSFFMVGYLLWGVFWGYQIVSKPIHDFFGKMIVIEDNLFKLFFEYVMKKLIIFGIIVAIGFIVGTFGGAIYKQIKLSQIAYK